MHLLRRAVPLATFAALATISVSSAFAADARLLPTEKLDVTVAAAKQQDCATRSVTGEGVARRSVTAPADGFLTARLSAPASDDWDLAIVDGGSPQVLNSSAAFRSNEIATTRVRRGQELIVQACRLEGDSATADVTAQFTAAALPSSAQKVKLVRVPLKTPSDRDKLASLGLDTADHATTTYWDVMIHSDADERQLQQAGFSYDVRIADVLARDRSQRAAELQARGNARARALARQAIPSGRTQYRTLPNIEQELKDLAAANPAFVRTFALPIKSLEGRDITGIEIAENVTAAPDGRPAYVQVGTHHAREWPANEATIEFGRELIDGYKSGDPRLSAIVRGARTYVIPVLNVDGFDATIQSEGLRPGGPNYVDPVDDGQGAGNAAPFATGAYKRKNCRADPMTQTQATPCIARTWNTTDGGLTDYGVDPNRNYGVEWGGPGTFTDNRLQTFHGAGPFSEPETEAFHEWLRDRQPTVLITNHTFTGLILRPPGTNRSGPTPDEARMRALGDAMAAQTNYISQYSYQLYDTTGTTDDYIYDGLGGYSFTPEIGKVEFHPAYTEFIAEYDGRPVVDANGNPTGQKLGGLREAFTLAGLTAIDADSHSVLTGTAPAGRVIRISKSISYRTSDRPDDNGIQYPIQTITEPRASTLVVPSSGRFEWHVNPSSQPRSGQTTPWRLTCEDAGGRVLESRDVFVARAQSVNLALSCAQSAPTNPTPTRPACVAPDGFRSVNVSRRGSGLRISFSRKAANPVTVEIVQTSIGRKIIRDRRVVRFTNRSRSFNWNGRGAKKRRLRDGTYFVRLSVRDASRRTDIRRVAVERKRGRFSKRGAFELVNRCA